MFSLFSSAPEENTRPACFLCPGEQRVAAEGRRELLGRVPRPNAETVRLPRTYPPKPRGASSRYPDFPTSADAEFKAPWGSFSHPFATVLQNGETRGHQSALNFHGPPIPPINVEVDTPALHCVFSYQHWVGEWGSWGSRSSECCATGCQLSEFLLILKLKISFCSLTFGFFFRWPVELC